MGYNNEGMLRAIRTKLVFRESDLREINVQTRSLKQCSDVKKAKEKFIKEYQLSNEAGEIHMIPVNRFLDFLGNQMHLKDSPKFLDQTKNTYPIINAGRQYNPRDLSVLVVFRKKPDSQLHLPPKYSNNALSIQIFYAHNPEVPPYVMDPLKLTSKEKKALKINDKEIQSIDEMIGFLWE